MASEMRCVITGMEIDCAGNHLDFIVLFQGEGKREKKMKTSHNLSCLIKPKTLFEMYMTANPNDFPLSHVPGSANYEYGNSSLLIDAISS
jgi:hypothetical protein